MSCSPSGEVRSRTCGSRSLLCNSTRSKLASCGPGRRKESGWSRVYRACTPVMCRLYIEAGCLAQRLQEGIAARRLSRLLDYGVSVHKAGDCPGYSPVSEVREMTVLESRSVSLMVYSCCCKFLPSPTVYSIRCFPLR